MIFTGILVGAVLLDLLFGDPFWLPHPVVIIGKLIDKLEEDEDVQNVFTNMQEEEEEE